MQVRFQDVYFHVFMARSFYDIIAFQLQALDRSLQTMQMNVSCMGSEMLGVALLFFVLSDYF